MSAATPILWTPDETLRKECNLQTFADWLAEREGLSFDGYEALWSWSVAEGGDFWSRLLDYFSIDYTGTFAAPVAGPIEEARWFEGVQLNYAAHSFAKRSANRPALICQQESGTPYELSWERLEAEVAGMQQLLIAAGVGTGDRVAGFLPNTQHAIIGFLATAGLGAVWSSCSPDFGAEAVADRFVQINPKVLLACRTYGYGGKSIDRTDVITSLAKQLPELKAKVLIDATGDELPGWQFWPETLPGASITVESVPFNHPLWILFSSGTTGKPKAIVHSHGGCLLEHLKYLHLQADVREGERFFWFTTTGWMMWNFLQASLLVGAVPVLFDGSPGYPKLSRLWKLAADLPIHHFGTSAPFLHACLRKGIDAGAEYDLSALRCIGSTGAPLSEEGFAYVYERIKADVWLTSMSGGTDVCTAFVGGNPWTNVRRGVIQGRALGCDLHAYSSAGKPVLGVLGELVVRQPMPSMPIAFWGDAQGTRRRASYFEDFPGAWRHGDWITLDEVGGVVIHGRSDATLNRQGVRIGTAEIYRVMETLPEVADSLIINYQTADGEDLMPLFVKLDETSQLTESLTKRIKHLLRTENSPRHVPTSVIAVSDIPYTISGKKLEAPVKRLFMGGKLADVANLGALRNPAALQAFATLASEEA